MLAPKVPHYQAFY